MPNNEEVSGVNVIQRAIFSFFGSSTAQPYKTLPPGPGSADRTVTFPELICSETALFPSGCEEKIPPTSSREHCVSGSEEVRGPQGRSISWAGERSPRWCVHPVKGLCSVQRERHTCEVS